MTLDEKVDKCLTHIHEIQLSQVNTEHTLTRNTEDIEKHIRRTDLLEKKLSKVYTFALIAGGFVAAKYGTEIMKIAGILI